MNIISQNCLAAHIYKYHLNEEYKNPFMWTVISFNDMKLLIENFNKIDFFNYELIRDKDWKFNILIDGLVKIQFVHYKFKADAKIPLRKGPDIFYNKIWEYIVLKYEERVSRMIKNNESPIFYIVNTLTEFKDSHYTNEQLDFLSKYKNVKVIKNLEKFNNKQAAEKVFEIMRNSK